MKQQYSFKSILVFISMAVIAAPGISAAADSRSADFWLSPSADVYANSSYDDGITIQSSLVQKYRDHAGEVYDKEHVYSAYIEADGEQFGFALANNYSEKERGTAMAARFGALSLYKDAGGGESYLRNQNAFHGLNPYAFHGGNIVRFRYDSTAIAYAFKNSNQIQLGESTVYAKGLEDRRARYIDFSNHRLFARFTHIERGSESIANGFDAGMNFGRWNVGYQQLENRLDTSTRRIRINWDRDVRNSFWLDFTAHENAALSEYTDNQIMFSWSHLFSASSLAEGTGAAAEESDSDKKKKNTGLKRGLLVGGIAAAGALLSSSGSKSQDEANRLLDQHNAARMRFNQINPVSVRENREYGGFVYQAADGSFATTEPIRGEVASITLPAPRFAVPVGTFARASYHTHGGFDPRFDSENFSSNDLEADRQFNIDGYLATPRGIFRYHDVETGQISTLGTVNN